MLSLERKQGCDDTSCNKFIITYSCIRRYQGAWHNEERIVFPGKIFCDCADKRDTKWSQVNPEEEAFLKSLCNPAYHIEFSRGYIHHGEIHITEGTLQGRESYISYIDRHKRLARVKAPGSEGRQVTVGLEIYRKD